MTNEELWKKHTRPAPNGNGTCTDMAGVMRDRLNQIMAAKVDRYVEALEPNIAKAICSTDDMIESAFERWDLYES